MIKVLITKNLFANVANVAPRERESSSGLARNIRDEEFVDERAGNRS